MPTFYLTRPGGVLRFENGCFVAEARGEPDVTVPEFKVEGVVAFGPVHLTQPAISRLLAKRAGVLFLTRFGVPRGRLCACEDARADVRLAQYRAFADDQFRLETSRSIVAAKIANCRQIVMRWRRNHPDPELKQAAAELKRAALTAPSAATIDELRGIEGAAARLYFDLFGKMVCDQKLFDGRSRRPPRDPANALLSLGYTLLGGEIMGHLSAQGLDPYLGFYHMARRGLPALAQDMLEEFRSPVVDRLVLATLNTGQVTADDFCSGPKGGLRLKQQPLKRFLRAYEEALNDCFAQRDGSTTSLRRVAAGQAVNIRQSCNRVSEYKPFRWERG